MAGMTKRRSSSAPAHLTATLALLGDALREPETLAAYHPDELIRAQLLYQRLRAQLAAPGQRRPRVTRPSAAPAP